MNSDDLVEIADRLYAEPVAAFTPARDAAAKASADKDLGKRIKGLRKPTTAAWAVNLLVRREGAQIEQVLELAAGLRAAAESLDAPRSVVPTRPRHRPPSVRSPISRVHGPER